MDADDIGERVGVIIPDVLEELFLRDEFVFVTKEIF